MFAEIKGLNEECGVFAIWGHKDAAQITYYGLHSSSTAARKEPALSFRMVNNYRFIKD